MWLDALLAYLHYTVIFILFALMTTELVLIRGPLEARTIRLLGKVDGLYAVSALLVLATGILRLVWGAKGADFYMGSWPFYVKLALFVAVGVISIRPTLAFIGWKRQLDHDPAWAVPEEERLRLRRLLLLQVHLAAMIPVFAVIMSRGLGH